MKTILTIIGARPQFIKHAPMQMELQKKFNALTIHTGQHYDANMSKVFFEDLKIAAPDFIFDIGQFSLHGAQTAAMMIEIEKVCLALKPDAIIIYGDTNSTLAAAIVASKLHIKQVHIEAGLRSFNRQMPEEINRIIADEFADLLFCPTKKAIENLRQEGIIHAGVHLCGDVMCDILKIIEPKVSPIEKEPYYFATIHRPYNTDEKERLIKVLNALNQLNKLVVFPIHPRTVNRMITFGLDKEAYNNIKFIEPIGYLESISYQKYADCIITDSGGIQKEAYMLKKKCITIRSETEWLETLENGWNTLLFEDLKQLQQIIEKPTGNYLENMYGDGHAAKEIVSIIEELLIK